MEILLAAILASTVPEPYWFDRQPGRRLQVGGALALAIGILLLIFLPHPALGSAINVRGAGWTFLGIGIVCLLAGTFGRKLLL